MKKNKINYPPGCDVIVELKGERYHCFTGPSYQSAGSMNPDIKIYSGRVLQVMQENSVYSVDDTIDFYTEDIVGPFAAINKQQSKKSTPSAEDIQTISQIFELTQELEPVLKKFNDAVKGNKAIVALAASHVIYKGMQKQFDSDTQEKAEAIASIYLLSGQGDNI